MKITSFIIRTLCVGTVGSLACQAAIQAYADDVPSTFVEGNYSPEVARYVQSIAGVALASGIHDTTKTPPAVIRFWLRSLIAAM